MTGLKQIKVAYAIEQLAHGQVRASNELRKPGVLISPSGIRCVWLRNNLACFKDRLKALEEKSAKDLMDGCQRERQFVIAKQFVLDTSCS